MMYDYGYNDYSGVAEGVGSFLGALLIVYVIILLIGLAVSIVLLIAQWKLFKKAGKGGWEAIVPFYCNYVLVEIAGLKWYWFLGFFAPLVLGSIEGIGFLGWLVYLFTLFNIFFNISKKFHKGTGFAVCLTLFTPICVPILGFSKNEQYDASVPVSPNGVFGQPEENNNSTVSSQPTQQYNQQPVEQSVPVVNTQMSEPTVNTPKFCTSCGSSLQPNAKFCTNCGKQI